MKTDTKKVHTDLEQIYDGVRYSPKRGQNAIFDLDLAQLELYIGATFIRVTEEYFPLAIRFLKIVVIISQAIFR